MKQPIFKTQRRGLLGDRPMGAEYMADVIERAKRLEMATRVKPARDDRQLRLPFSGGSNGC